MVDKKIVEKEFAMEWRYSIVRSWESARPLIMKYRETRGKDYWNDFEDIYNMAKKIDP